MLNQNISKIKGLIGIANKANYLVIGADNLKNDRKKLFLILHATDCGKGIVKVANYNKERTNCEVITLDNEQLIELTEIETCKIVGIRNKGISDEIIKLIRGENIG